MTGTPSLKLSSNEAVLPLSWCDALVELAVELPRAKNDREFVEMCIDRISSVLSDCAVGLRLTPPRAADPIVVWVAPESVSVERTLHASRMFPSMLHEQQCRLADSAPSLHVAHSQRALSASEAAFAERAFRLVVGAASARQSVAALSQEFKTLQAQIVQSDKLATLGRIVAGVAHDLNNPLTSIMTYGRCLQKSTLERAERGELVAADLRSVQRVMTSAERISTLSRTLVGYAKPATSIPVPTSLELVIRQALAFCEHEFRDRQVTVIYTPSEPTEILAVHNQLTQVFVNLFTNAAHAMQERGGTLEIRSTANESTGIAQIDVQDTGTGIAPEHLGRIFEPFFTTKLGDQGTGLGLSIVRDTVQSLGGQVEVSSTPQRGTVFRLDLPLAAPRGPRPARAPE